MTDLTALLLMTLYNTRLNLMVNDALHYNFPLRRCIYMNIMDVDFGDIVAKVASDLQLPVITSIPVKNYGCGGYVLTSSNFSDLRRIFQETEMKPHKKILIFYNGKENFIVDPFIKAAHYKAVHIQVIQGNIYDGDNMEVVTVYKNKTCRLNDATEECYQQLSWRPKFQENDTFKISSFNCTPFIFINSENKVHEGLEYRMLKEITKDWAVKYNIHNYTFSDLYGPLIQDIYNNKADIAICSQWRDFADRNNLDLTYPYSQACVTYLVPKPIRLPEFSFVFQPLSQTFWGMILAAIIFTSTSLYFTAKHVGGTTVYQEFSLGTLSILSSICLIGWYNFPRERSLRIIITSWSVMCIMISNGYSAGFSSILTSPRYYRRINTLDDMISYQIKWGSPDEKTKDFYEYSNQTKLKNIADLYVLEKSLEDRELMIRGNSHSVMVKWLPGGYVTDTDYLGDYPRNNLKILNDCIGMYYLVFVLKIQSPYKQLLDEAIVKFTESGLIKHWYYRIITLYGESYFRNFFASTNEYISKEHVPFTFEKTKGALYFLISGLTLSFLVFCIEFVIALTTATV